MTFTKEMRLGKAVEKNKVAQVGEEKRHQDAALKLRKEARDLQRQAVNLRRND